jgi:hypothetical protein
MSEEDVLGLGLQPLRPEEGDDLQRVFDAGDARPGRGRPVVVCERPVDVTPGELAGAVLGGGSADQDVSRDVGESIADRGHRHPIRPRRARLALVRRGNVVAGGHGTVS